MTTKRVPQQGDVISRQPHQRQDSQFLTRLPAEIRIMIYHCTLPGQAIHLWVDKTGKMMGKICFFEQHPATKPNSCDNCALHDKVRPQLLALLFTCRLVCAETLPIYQSKIFIVQELELPLLYRWMAVHTFLSDVMFRFNPFRRLQVNLGHAKGGSESLAGLRAACLRTVARNEIDAKEICIIFVQEASSLIHRFPLTKSAILTLGKMRGLKNFRLVFQDMELNSHPDYLTSKLKFQRKVAAMEEIFRKFTCVESNAALDQDAREMTKSDNRFFLGFRAKLEQILLEKYAITLD